MKLKSTLCSLLLGIWSFSTARADTRTSADYTIPSDAVDSGGNAGSTTDYQLIGSLSDIGSAINATSTDDALWNGYIGQLLELTSGPALQFVTGASLPAGRQASAYSQTLAATGGVTPYTFSLISGSLPPGLVLSSAGVISGTPTATGTSTFTIQVSDSDYNGVTRTFTLAIHAFSFTWSAGNGDWGSAANWNPNGVPGPDDLAIINNGGAVTVSDIRAVGQLNLNSGILNGTGTLTVGNVMNWTGGSMNDPGRTIIASNAMLNMTEALSLAQRTLENAGTVVWTGTNNFSCIIGAVLTNRPGATWEVRNNHLFNYTGSGGAPRFDNAGIFRKTLGDEVPGVTTFTGGFLFTNYGTNEVLSGTVLFSDQFVNLGTTTIAGGALLQLAGGGSASGTFDNQNGGTVDWAGAGYSLNGGVLLTGPGNYTNRATLTINTSVAIQNFGLTGILNGPGTLTINTLMNWTGGSMNDPGRTIIASNATLNMTEASSLAQRTLENAGTVVWTGTANFACIIGAVLTNRPGATWEVRNNQLFNYPGTGSAPRFDNAGAFYKALGTQGPGTTTFTGGFLFNNYGSIEVLSGTLLFSDQFVNPGSITIASGALLQLAGGGSASGTFDNQNGGTVDWAGAGYSLNAGALLTGPGNYTNRATLTLNANVAIQNFGLTGILNGAGTLTINNVMNWTSGTMIDPGRTLIASNATLNMTGVSLSQRTLENAGIVLWTGTGNLTCTSGAVVTNRLGATWEVRNNQLFNYPGSGSAPRFDNAGTFRKVLGDQGPGTTIFTGGFLFVNYGTSEVLSGTLLFSDQFVNPGSIIIASGALLQLAGGGSASGTFDNQNGGTVDWAGGGYSLNGGALLNGPGNYTNRATLTLNTNVAIQKFGLTGILNGAGTLTINNVMNWTSGTMIDPGRTLIASNATLNMTGVNLSQRTLENAGIVLWTGTGNLTCTSGAVVTNRLGATWEVRNNQLFNYPGTGSAPRFDNAGIFRKVLGDQGPGTTIFTGGFLLTNYGTNEVLSGTLEMDSPYAQYAGLTSLCSGSLVNRFTLQVLGGEIRGSGNIFGDVNNVGGTVSPGCSPGQLTISGSYIQGASGTLNIELAGTTPGVGYDRLAVSGTVTLAGTLRTTLANGFYPAANGMFGVLTDASRSGAFSSFISPTNDVGMELIYAGSSSMVHVINVRPNIPAIGTQTLDEMVPFSLPVGATDDDLPAQTLSYALSNAPAGMTITSSGVINWTPDETQGPGTNTPTVLVWDNGTPNLTNSRTFQIVVNEVNRPPVLTLPPNTNVNELVHFSAAATATDPDIPTNALTFALVSGPAGLTVSTNGAIDWTPLEPQGPGTYSIFISVTDTNPPAVNSKSLSVTNSFQIVVNEVNLPPVLTVPPDQTINELATLNVTNTATDPDLPANPLTFTIVSGPTGVVLNATSGVLTWTPSEQQGPSTNVITVRVTDSSPSAVNAQQLSDTKSFTVVVNEINLAPALTLPPDTNINEMITFSATAIATDPDIPANTLTFALVSGPAGLTVSTNGAISWTPLESQGPSTNIVFISVTDTNPPAVNAKSLSVTNSFQIVVNEVNLPPSLTVPGNQTLTEQTPLAVSASATDPDLPPNGLSFSLVSPPAGMTIHPISGAISWTPGEEQGSNTYNIMVVVTDDSPQAVNAQHFSVTNSFLVTVNESNRPPALTLPPDTNINEMVAFSATATATDPDIPANPLTFALVSGPAGLTVSTSGVIAWTPMESQGPSTNTVLISVTDTNPPAVNAKSLSVTNSFQIVVNEVNLAPVMAALTNRTVSVGQTISFTATATDADLPANMLTFNLISPPGGASVDSASGLFNWRIKAAQADTTNLVQVTVQDDGTPRLSATQSFTVIVNPLASVVLTPLDYNNGQFRLQISGPAGPDYVIMASTNLVQWNDLTTNLSPNPPFLYTDTDAGSSTSRIYRVRLRP